MVTNPLLLIDFYKTTHSSQYPKDMTKLVSYLTPRMSRIKDDKLIIFGLQGFIKTYLIKAFNEGFFNRDEDEVVSEYERVLTATLGKGTYDSEKIRELHKLGYLPLKIRAIPEGTRVPIKVPMIEISNTHPKFAWLVNTVESLMSAEMWHPMVSANVGYNYRQIVNKYFDISVDDNIPRARALGDFSFRGQESVQSAIKSSSAFCLSFLNTATVPAILYLEENYNCDCTKEPVAFGSISTEHSVMCSNFAVDGDEKTMVKRLLTEIYPNNYFTMVSDSYNYWNLVDNILPSLKEEIMNRPVGFAIRGDSGDPVEIVTETVFHLWQHFGGTVNSKGYKVLDPHVKAIYGDSITVQRCEEIYKKLIEKGFACNNVALGVGSFSMQCVEEDDILKPFTRDTFGIAVKSTYCEVNGEPYKIFKNPITDSGNFKQSQKGLCFVFRNRDGEIDYIDELQYNPYAEEYEDSPTQDLLISVFEDGTITQEYTLAEIRDILHGGKF